MTSQVQAPFGNRFWRGVAGGRGQLQTERGDLDRGGAGRLPDTAVARRTGTDGWWTSRLPQLHRLIHTRRLNNSIYAT